MILEPYLSTPWEIKAHVSILFSVPTEVLNIQQNFFSSCNLFNMKIHLALLWEISQIGN